jgi:hypothetical protein
MIQSQKWKKTRSLKSFSLCKLQHQQQQFQYKICFSVSFSINSSAFIDILQRKLQTNNNRLVLLSNGRHYVNNGWTAVIHARQAPGAINMASQWALRRIGNLQTATQVDTARTNSMNPLFLSQSTPHRQTCVRRYQCLLSNNSLAHSSIPSQSLLAIVDPNLFPTSIFYLLPPGTPLNVP